MNRKDVISVVRNLPVGSQLILTLKRENVAHVEYLYGMIEAKQLGADPATALAVEQIFNLGHWGQGANAHVISVFTTVLFYPEWFTTLMAEALEDIKVVKPY